MKPALQQCLLIILSTCLTSLSLGQSIFADGNAFKIAIEKEGVYRINRSMLAEMGFNVSEIDPANIRISGNTGGMLPQANSAARAAGPEELSIFVSGQDDGAFDNEDFILFYAEGATKATYSTSRNTFSYNNNLYSDKNFYFVSVGDQPGKRIQNRESISGTFPVITEYDDFVVHEVDAVSAISSGREWFGEKFKDALELTLSFSIEGIVANSEIKIISHVMGQTFEQGKFRISLNGTEVLQQPLLPIIKSTYALKGYHRKDTVTFNESIANASASSQQQLRYTFEKPTSSSEAYLDLVLMHVKRTLAQYGNQNTFASSTSLQNPISTFQFATTVNGTVWDITDPTNVLQQSLADGNTSFAAETSTLRKFIVFNNEFLTPELVDKVEAQDLRGLPTPNLIIITHPDFIEEAQRLRDHRSTFNGLAAHVVLVDQIYNEFSSGRQDITAIRDFIRYLYNQSPQTLMGALMFGKGSYDYKNRVTSNTNFVPTYESRNSLHPLQTYSSDDYFGFMDEDEGDWGENPVRNHTMDIGIGRLPVSDIEEAKAVVDKLIEYDTSLSSFGYWRKEIAFIADDGSHSDGWTSLHQAQANDLTEIVEETSSGIDSRKFFMGTYPKKVNAGSETVPKLEDDIHRVFAKGALIVNFTGHGSEEKWTDETVFSKVDIFELENDIYPFMVTATCEFGRQDDPRVQSGAELCVVKANGGAIGMVTTARPVNATTNFDLNSAFYHALFTRVNGRYRSVGEVFRETKNNSQSGVANRNFSLLGDPSMRLALPENIINITSITGESGSDTLKALETITVTGRVEDASGSLLSDFNGILEAELFDKQSDFITIGRNDPEFEFKQWHNVLFHGQATVKDGMFELSFVLPKNISYAIAPGKLSLYAYDLTHRIDAKGSNSSFKIGGGALNPAPDNEPPTIAAYMGDATFVDGGSTAPNTQLVVRLEDNSGINISDYGIGNGLMAVLDDNETFVLNEYFISDVDDFRKGWVNFPLQDLTPGRHTIVVKAWDVFNNAAEGRVSFVVSDNKSIVIEEFGNYPNPFVDESMLFFTHNRSGDDLEAMVTIYSPAGNVVDSREVNVTESSYRVDLLTLDTGSDAKKLPAGLYLARLVVRSVSNGSKNEKLTKLIILN